jgi:photosystem II stability/assembly factor-like uncharacterized protein
MTFSSVNEFYFNGIHCISDTHCVAVAEGHKSANPGSYIFTTTDGETWKQTNFEAGGGAMGVRMITEKEVWVAATSNGKEEPKGNFFHSLDGGQSWASGGQVLDASPIGLDCTDTQHCIAPSVNPLTQTCLMITFHPSV